MRRHSEIFPLVLIAVCSGFVFIFKNAYDNLFYGWVLQEFTRAFGPVGADVLAKISSLAPSLGGAALLVWFLVRYARNEFERMHSDEMKDARLDLANLRDEGVQIRIDGMCLKNATVVEPWVEKAQGWDRRVIRAIARIDEPD